MSIKVISLHVDSGGNSEIIAISNTAAVSASAIVGGECLFHPKVDCYVRKGTSAVVAVDDGSDIFLPKNQTYRLTGFESGEYLGVIRAESTDGNGYLSPGV